MPGEIGILGQITHRRTVPCRSPAWWGGFGTEGHLAGRRRNKPREHLEQGGLSCAVGAGEGGDACLQFKGGYVEDGLVAVPDDEVVGTKPCGTIAARLVSSPGESFTVDPLRLRAAADQ
ncbi:hypothetical protein SAV14893_095430 [Streptomyces avermitilis]|uniref:Uncharacterized protein n=1 Tax=Streptomyces avermitilis TaxID=33903 RepID=A0A4D4MDV8_STRAX|nr:hypothetical protein SAV14893_095430 [Streptomyces avermitilis]GDY80447.1 hypothetical protein SAV31267_099320 [Streptomyces avermitilis]